MEQPFLLELIFLLIAAVIFVPLCQAIKLGAVPGFILAGIAIGPSALGLISNVEHISHLSEFGVVLLLFVIGMEMKPSYLWKIRRLVFGLGGLQVLLTGLVLAAISYYLLDLSFSAATIIGYGLALSSTAFVLQILSQQKALNLEHGRISVAILLMQDLAVVPLLAIIPMLSIQTTTTNNLVLGIAQSVGILLAVILTGRYLLTPFLFKIAKSANSEVFTATALLIVLGAAYLTEHAGLSMAMGAFLAGLLISNSAYRHQIKAEVQPFRGLLLGSFFMSMGMVINLSLLSDHVLIVILLVIASVMIKALLLTPLVRSFGFSWRRSTAVGLLLSQSGEFALVLFSLAFVSKILTQFQYDISMLVVLVSMIFTPVLSACSNWINKGASTLRNAPLDNNESSHKNQDGNQTSAEIVIVGFGRVGRNIAQLLTSAKATQNDNKLEASSNLNFVAFDNDPSIVSAYSSNNNIEGTSAFPVFYGDPVKSILLVEPALKKAKLAIITVNSTHDAIELVSAIRDLFPDIRIIARGHNSQACASLIKCGADEAISENIEVSLEISELIINNSTIPVDNTKQLIYEFRENYYNKIRNSTDNN